MDKKIKVKKYNNFYFYKALNVFPEEFLPKLYDYAVYWLESTRKEFSILTETVGKEAYPPEASGRLLDIPAYKNDPISIKYYNELKLHIAKYCEISKKSVSNLGNNYLDVSNLKFHSSWITRVADIETEEYSKEVLRGKRERYSAFGNLHSHENNPVGMVYYLKNPDPKYGTIIKLSSNEMFNNNGEENSLLIFNPKLYHSPLYPTNEDLEKSPRITIVTDCCSLL